MKARLLAATAAFFYGVCVLYIELNLTFEHIYYLFIPFFTVLSLTYIMVIAKLNSKMKRLVGDFNMEIDSINRQFIVFLVAYVTRLAFWIT